MNSYKKDVFEIKHHGRKIYGVLYAPEAVTPTPIIIFSHGFNGVNTDFSKNSEYLASRGIASFCFDFCGGSVNSKSDFCTTEMTIFTEKEDLCAVIEYFKQVNWIDKSNMFLFGGSQGGLVTALTAEEYIDDIKGIMLLFPALGIPENWNKRFPRLEDIPDTVELWGVVLGRVFFEAIHGFDTLGHIGKFDKSVMIFQGDKDEVVSLEYSKKASRIYTKAEFITFPGEGHGFSEQGNQRVTELTYEFILANSEG